MKTEEIHDLFNRFEAAAIDLNGVECWSARECNLSLRNSSITIIKLQITEKSRSLKNAFQTAPDHFPDVSNMVVRGSGSVVEIWKIYIIRCESCFIATC
ncbi:MAG TPA: hypothetical protein DEP77_13975 [Bacteroidales bacterium]|nr:hypothetical protein [Bacteroidales bacterium]